MPSGYRKDGSYSGRVFQNGHKGYIGHIGYWKNKSLSEKHKKAIGVANKGHKHSKITVDKMSKKMKGKYLGSNHPNWKGGRTTCCVKVTGEGYNLIYSPNHPFHNYRRYVLEHRLVMEKYFGRYLTKNEFVHHINGIKNDNRIENLRIFILGKNWHPHTCPKCGFEFDIK